MSAIIHKWLRIKYGKSFHCRVGVRKQFLCGKRYSVRFRIPYVVHNLPKCDRCASALAFAEDMYGGADD